MFALENKLPPETTVSEKNSEEKTYFISLPQVDTRPRIIPLSVEQLNNLALNQPEFPAQETKVTFPQNDQINIKTKRKAKSTANIVYKIIKPEDLDLKPTNTKYLPRGRPKKKICVEKTPNADNDQKKILKQARTRSGRITKPPKHIEVDFKKIDITDDSDLKTLEFEPLKTNASQVKQEPLLALEHHFKKRNIPARYRCPTCNKAYLGKAKMLSHFEKHPDHGSVPANVICKNTATWDFLVLTAQKFKGSKVVKFCEEFITLLENAKKIAKYLFKPVNDTEQGYFIKDQLATIFGIKEGSYCLDDAELSKDVSLYEYLENNTNVKSDKQCEHVVKQKDTVKVHLNVQENTNKIPEIDVLNNHLNNQNSLALVKYEIPKLFNFSTSAFPTNSVSDGNYDHHAVGLEPRKDEQQKCVEEKKEVFHQLQKEMTLQNDLHDVDELMLENVDTGQVNILETSSNSDDIMNVDQFVNERFKKLTEPDMDIQGNSLNLELPPLDIFQFHTS